MLVALSNLATTGSTRASSSSPETEDCFPDIVESKSWRCPNRLCKPALEGVFLPVLAARELSDSKQWFRCAGYLPANELTGNVCADLPALRKPRLSRLTTPHDEHTHDSENCGEKELADFKPCLGLY